jgi:hypothetical protein
MTNPTIRIHNAETDEVVDRPMTAEEFAEYKIEVKATDEIRAERLAKETAKAALLERLGITADEAALLLS